VLAKEDGPDDTGTSLVSELALDVLRDQGVLPGDSDRQRDDLFASWEAEGDESEWDDLLADVAEDAAGELDDAE
jgi:hypothetical protein